MIEEEEKGDGGGRRSRSRSSSSSSSNNSNDDSGSNGGGSSLTRCTLLLVFFSGAMLALGSHLLAQQMRSSPWRRKVEPTKRAYLPEGSLLALVEEEEQHFQSFSTSKEVGRRASSQVQPYRDCEPEAIKAMEAALKAKTRTKAKRLYEHSLTLCPRHPRVLVSYGELLEKSEEDLVEADRMYSKAIAFSQVGSEEHTRALSNRQRMAGLVEEQDLRLFKMLDEKKKAFRRLSVEEEAAMNRAKRETYFQHVFHTVGIEGNTLSLSQTRFILETGLAVAGKSVVEHNEVIGLDSALRYVNQTLVAKAGGDVTLQDILEIHRRVLGHADPFTAGAIRQTQVFVSNHVPPSPGEVELLLHRLVAWLNNPDRSTLHAVQLAALAHYKFVHIHPFADGNGRTSRLLMNLILMQSGFPPVIIRKKV